MNERQPPPPEPGPSWTEELTEPLRSAARGGRWCRIEEHRAGGWILLSDRGAGDVDWWHLPSDSGDADAPPLAPLDPLEDARLPELARTVSEALRMSASLELLAWRVGSRAIFRLVEEGTTRMVKVYRKDRDILRRWEILPAEPGAPWRVPRVLAWDPRRKRLEIEFCPGTSLNASWLAGDTDPRHGERVAALLGWLAATDLPPDFPSHPVEEEIRVLSERVPVFDRTLRSPSPRVGPLFDRVVEALRGLPEVPPVLCHRDFHDKQILIDGDRGTLIDMDLAAAGHPALDVGNILAHLRLRELKGAELRWQEVASPIAVHATRDRGIEDSLPIWTASTLLRLALIYARRFRRPGLIEALLDSTEAALDRSGEWEGLLS